MSRIDWSKLAKVGKLTLALGSAAIFSASVIAWGLGQQTKYEQQADHKASKHAHYTRDYVRRNCIVASVVGEQDCASKANDTQREYERKEYNLLAQRTSALWAMIIGAAAVIGMLLSAVGVLLVWTTFNATREANAIAKQSMRTQNRAYLSVSEPLAEPFYGKLNGVESGRRGMRINAQLKNTGSTPALSVRAATNLQIIGEFEDPVEFVWPENHTRGYGGVIQPGDETFSPIEAIGEADVARLHPGRSKPSSVA